MAITRQVNADLDEVALKDDGTTLLAGSGIPNGGFYLVEDGTLSLGIAIRYRFNKDDILETGWELTTNEADTEGRNWVFIITAYMKDIELPITDLYDVTLMATTIVGETFSVPSVNLQYLDKQYILYPLPREDDEPNTGKVNVVQEIVYPNVPLLSGIFKLGFRAVNKQTGEVLDNTMILTAVDPKIGQFVNDPVLGTGVYIGV